jgi:hypothetical protein
MMPPMNIVILRLGLVATLGLLGVGCGGSKDSNGQADGGGTANDGSGTAKDGGGGIDAAGDTAVTAKLDGAAADMAQSTDVTTGDTARDVGTAPLAIGSCKALNVENSADCSAGQPPHLYLCEVNMVTPPEDGCVHPSIGVNQPRKFCCPHQLCTRQEASDSLCAGKPGTPKAVQCGTGAAAPAGCVPSGAPGIDFVNSCCP